MSEPSVTPSVQDQRSKPSGVLPKNTQPWVLGGVAAIMIVVIMFSGRNSPSEKKLPASGVAGVVDPNATRIQEYEKGIEEQTRKLRLEQAQIARTQGALGWPEPPAAPASLPTGAQGYSNATEPHFGEPSAESVLEADLQMRAYQSRFASNVALSYRSGTTALEPPSVPTTFPHVSAIGPYGAVASGSAEAQSQPLDAAALPATPAVAGVPKQIAAGPGRGEATEGSSTEHNTDSGRALGKRYRLFEGTVLETVLTNRLDGSFSGPVNCMVTANVYSHNDLHLLIPQGSRVLGEVRRVESSGDQRLAVFFHRLIMPDGYSTSLDKYQGLSQIGETGLQDQINHHYLQIFGVSLAIGAIAGLSQANTSYGPNESASDAYRQGVSSSLSQSSLHILDRYLNVLPTFTIREGQRVKVYLSDDLLLPAYDQHELSSDL